MNKYPYPTLISIQGVTGSGKSSLSIDLAKYFLNQKNDSVWVINADSRQVYKNLNIGTAKINGKWEEQDSLKAFYFEDSSGCKIPHFLIDYINLDQDYGLTNYISDFESLMSKDNIPKYIILVGGSGLYSKAIVSGEQPTIILAEFQKSFYELKEKLNKLSLYQLQSKISAEDKAKINYSDFNNSRRLINKILNETAKNSEWIDFSETKSKVQFEKVYQFGLKIDQEVWESGIKQRVEEWTFEPDENNKLIQETKNLEFLGPSKIQQLGFEYSITYDYIQGKFAKPDWQNRLFLANRKYAKKQQTWLNKQQSLVSIESLEEIVEILNL